MIQPTPIRLEKGSDAEQRLKRYLHDKVYSIREGLRPIHNKVVKWRRNYEARPAEAIREFPFHNASNLVVPIIAIHSNTLLARVMSSIIKTSPPWSARVIAAAAGIEELDGLSSAIEQFLGYVAFEPEELDLYRVCHEWVGETIRYGTSVLKSPVVREVEDFVVPSGDGSPKNPVFEQRTLYSGPRPEKIPFTDFGIAPTDKTVESSGFKYHLIRLHREDLEDRKYRGVYDPTAVADVLGQPDRTSPSYIQQQMEVDSGAKTTSGYGWAEWDIYECWFRFRIDNQHNVRCIVWYHEKTNTILRAYYMYYPQEPFVASRLFYRDDNFHGYGFCEMLEPLTEELSNIHNGRLDNQTVCNSKGFVVDPESKLHQGFRIFPSVMLPEMPANFEPFSLGEPSIIPIEAERLSLELAEKLTGVSGPMHGMGAGFNTKRGVYTAMGTLSLLQEGNTRTDLNVTDMRYAYTKLGRILCGQYAMTGLGDRKDAFGKLADKIELALRAMQNGQIILPVSASTASVNREVEKQNDLMLSGLLSRHYQQVTQMLQAASDPRVPPNIQKYIGESIISANDLMKTVLRHFNFDEVDKLVPEAQAQPPQQQPPPMGGVQ